MDNALKMILLHVFFQMEKLFLAFETYSQVFSLENRFSIFFFLIYHAQNKILRLIYY